MRESETECLAAHLVVGKVAEPEPSPEDVLGDAVGAQRDERGARAQRCQRAGRVQQARSGDEERENRVSG